MGEAGSIDVARDGSTLILTINRPEAANALTPTMMADLVATMDDFERDTSASVAILTAAGDRTFCAGGDLRSTIPAMRSEGLIAGSGPDPGSRFFSGVFKAIIAAVQGHCIAGGVEILLGTDIRLAVPSATFGLPEVRWGLVPSGGSHVRLPRQIPWAVAMEMILTGRPLTAERAREVGLVNQVVERDDLMNSALKLARTVSQNGPRAVRTAKAIAVRALFLEPSFRLEAELSADVWQAQEVEEGLRAFEEKRAPNYTGD